MRNKRAVPETKGVTVKLLASLDLGPEIEGMAGRQLRMRMVTIEAYPSTRNGYSKFHLRILTCMSRICTI